jgi:hypothetical protein
VHPARQSLTGEALADRMFPTIFGAIAAPAMFGPLLDLATRFQPRVMVDEVAELAAPVVASALGRPHVTHGFGLVVAPYRLALAAAAASPLWDAVGCKPRRTGAATTTSISTVTHPACRLTTSAMSVAFSSCGRTR